MGNIIAKSYQLMVEIQPDAVLGILVAGLFRQIGLRTGDSLRSLPVLTVLLVAVLDEYIQHFTGRGSAVTDVILDFSGGLFGLATALLRKKK